MDPISEKILISTKDLLTRIIASKELSPDFLTEAHLAATAVEYELKRQRSQDGYLAAARAKERKLADELRGLLGSGPVAVPRKWGDHWSESVGAELSRVIAGAWGGKRLDPALQRKLLENVRTFLIDYNTYFDPAIAGGTAVTYKGGRSDQEERAPADKLTAETLQAYVRRRFPDKPATEVVAFKKLAGGYSKETYLVTLGGSGVPEQRLVLRKDGVGLPTGGSVVNEFGVIKLARAHDIPAPNPLWLEPDESVFGTAVLAVDFVSGKPAHLNVPSDPDARRAWTLSFAECLAKLHRIRPDDPAFDLQASFARDIDAQEKLIIERERIAHPALVCGIAWLRENLPRLKGRPAALVHGDVGFHNIIMNNDRIVALLDWEFNHFSDPAEDLVYCKLFIDQLMPWDEFMTAYRAKGGAGADYPEEVAQFFDVWKEVRNAVSCLGSLNSLLMPEVDEVKLAVAGCVFPPKYEIAALDAMLR